MNALRNILVVAVVVMLVGVSGVGGATIVTTETIRAFVANAGINSCSYTTMDGFTVDGVAREDVWAVIVSEVDDDFFLNGYGRSLMFGDVAGFQFEIFGGVENPLVAASQIIMIINDDDPELFMIDSFGILTLGLGEDEVFDKGHLSINEGEFGDISEIFFDYDSLGDHFLSSVVLSTIPEPATVVVLAIGGIGILVRRKR